VCEQLWGAFLNFQLQKLFSLAYTPQQQAKENRGASSIEGTQKLRDELPELFSRYGIKSMFDAGCNDCTWASRLESSIDYHGGDISLSMVASVWNTYPHLNVVLHDVTSDPLPDVDVLFVRDVTIHLNNVDKINLLTNWLNSNIPWLLITHDEYETQNQDIDYSQVNFPVVGVNWNLSPWNFPTATARIYEFYKDESGRCMALWHQDQIKALSWQ